MDQKDIYWRWTKWLIAIVVLIFILPYVVLRDNCYIRIHDNLEGEWIWLKLMADHGVAFGIYSWVHIDQIMRGVPRNVMPPGLSLNMLLVIWLGMYKAYIVSDFLIRVIGFGGMIILLRTHIMDHPDRDRHIIWLCALIFAVLPVYVPFGLSVMGQPLLFWAFLNLQKYRKIAISYLVIILFPFYSSMVWLVVPFEVLLGVAVFYYYRKGEISNNFIFGGVLLVGIFILVNLPMLSLSVLNPDFISHRLSYNLYMFEKPNLVASLTDFVVTFFFCHYHVANFAPLVIMVALGLSLRRRAESPLAMYFFCGIIFVCLYQAFYGYGEYALMNKFAFIKSFRFNRFNILLPFLWLVSFALALETMQKSAMLRYLVFPFLVCQLLIALFGNDQIVHDYRTMVGHQKFPNYRNYMAPKQFAEIKKYIGEPVDSYHVASLGMSPSIAQYNGLFTLDGLLSIYDIRYKNEFRGIFAGEIAKSPDIQQYYDGWGNRCYIFSSELGTKNDAYNCSKFDNRSISHFAFNKRAFVNMEGKYLLSAVEIKNSEQTGLHLEKVFTDDESWWKIYLYSVKK